MDGRDGNGDGDRNGGTRENSGAAVEATREGTKKRQSEASGEGRHHGDSIGHQAGARVGSGAAVMNSNDKGEGEALLPDIVPDTDNINNNTELNSRINFSADNNNTQVGNLQRDSNFFRIGKRKLEEEIGGRGQANLNTNTHNNGERDGEVSCSVRLAQQMDQVQTILVRNSLLLREVQSAYVSLSSPLPSSSTTSRATASALRKTTLKRGGEMIAEINDNLTAVASAYEEAGRTFMKAVHESADNYTQVNTILRENVTMQNGNQ